MTKRLLCLLICLCLLLLCGCTAENRGEQQPDLRLLERPAAPAVEQNEPEKTPEPETAGMKTDLWLDASPVAGGVNPAEKSLYAHANKRYREGGFHWQYNGEAGWYITLLEHVLEAAGSGTVRVLRAGTERLPDEWLKDNGLTGENEDSLRSLRRDLLTYEINPLPTIFSEMSGESMSNSFYTPAGPALTRLENIPAAWLENPERREDLIAVSALQAQEAVNGNGELLQTESGMDSPLSYALENLDLSRLSVITFDPASIRGLSFLQEDGTYTRELAQLLEERGLFDAGLTCGLYAFTLDYMGEMCTFAGADLAEPLIWGKLKYNTATSKTEGVLPMPRTLLMLVTGTRQRVQDFTAALDAAVSDDPLFQEQRGPQHKELTYAYNGSTVTAEPFSFDTEYTEISRPVLPRFVQSTRGAQLACNAGEVTEGEGLPLVTLAGSAKEAPSICLSFPVDDVGEGVDADLGRLSGLLLQTESTCGLKEIRENVPGAEVPEGMQAITIRDRTWLYGAGAEGTDAFACEGAEVRNGRLYVTVSAEPEKLQGGYFRLTLTAAYESGGLTWDKVEWTDRLNVSPTRLQVSEWEEFTRLIHETEKKTTTVPTQFAHAWGPKTSRSYQGTEIPECPPVWQIPWLNEMMDQLREAADIRSVPALEYSFDVFVK